MIRPHAPVLPPAPTCHRRRGRRGGRRLVGLTLALGLAGLAWSGCQVGKNTAKLPAEIVAAFVPGSRPAKVDPAQLQVQVQRFADDFTGQTVVAMEEYARRLGSPAARREVLRWKVSLGTSIVGIASGPNPTANMLDMIAMASLMRFVLEERAPTTPNAAFHPWLDVARVFQTNAWALADGVLDARQRDELKATIDQVYANRSESKAWLFTRPHEFAAVIRRTGEERTVPGSVFGLVGLDPAATLDPAIQEVTRTRLLAERALYTAQRMPVVVGWQADLWVEDLTGREPVARALDTAARLGQTAADLPDRIAAERRAVLEAFEAQEGRLRQLAAEVGRTLDAGEKMSSSLNTTFGTFDALMKRFGVGEPPRESAQPAPPAGPPFDIRDYATTAERLTTLANQLDLLLRHASETVDSPELDRRLAPLRSLSSQARQDARSLLDHAFLLAASCILLTFACAMIFRRYHPRHAPVRDASAGP